jgi:hypothetical protein
MKRIILAIVAMFCTLNISAQNPRIIEGSVQDHRGNPITNATIGILGSDKVFKCDKNGNFSIEVPIQTFALTASAEGYSSKYLEVDRAYMLFRLKPNVSKKTTFEERLITVFSDNKPSLKSKEKQQATVKSNEPEQTKITNTDAKSEHEGPLSHEALVHNCIMDNIKLLGKRQTIDYSASKSHTELGDSYFNKGDIHKAFLHYYLGAQNSEPYSYYLLASYHETGYQHGTFVLNRNIDMAIAFYKKAAELNVPGAKEQIEKLTQKYKF